MQFYLVGFLCWNSQCYVWRNLGAVIALVLSMKVATINNRITSTQLILAGIAVSALFPLSPMCLFITQKQVPTNNTALYWMLGSLGGANWAKMSYGLTAFIVCSIVIGFFHKSLDVLMLGDETAATLGLDLRRTKTCIIILATVLTGTIVSISGVIGFVGLVIPHITRFIVGSSHRRLIPASVLVGGLFLIVCDVISRVIASPQELSIGVVTAFFGAPFFLFLIRKRKNAFRGRE